MKTIEYYVRDGDKIVTRYRHLPDGDDGLCPNCNRLGYIITESSLCEKCTDMYERMANNYADLDY